MDMVKERVNEVFDVAPTLLSDFRKRSEIKNELLSNCCDFYRVMETDFLSRMTRHDN